MPTKLSAGLPSYTAYAPLLSLKSIEGGREVYLRFCVTKYDVTSKPGTWIHSKNRLKARNNSRTVATDLCYLATSTSTRIGQSVGSLPRRDENLSEHSTVSIVNCVQPSDFSERGRVGGWRLEVKEWG